MYAFKPSTVTFHYLEQRATHVRQIRPYQLAISDSSESVRFIEEISSDTSNIADNQDPLDYLVNCALLILGQVRIILSVLIS